ncbi:MAG: reverse transcriptase domain-containing protein [Nanoarchaeota archaeon]
MKTYKNLYSTLCSYDNLFLAWQKARKKKTLKRYVIDFEENLEHNLLTLRSELLLHSYRPRPLKTFIIRDPKTRKISKSDFRDRIVHHALCNIIEPVFEKTFIYDSYANRKGKGTLKAVERYDYFKKKLTKNGKLVKNAKNKNDVIGWCLKADVYHYFDEVNHKTLVNIIKEKIADQKVIWLIKTILANHQTKERGVGMPLGNLTSQFFANIYLDKLDQYVKKELNAEYYIRYVDDFLILHKDTRTLESHKENINTFLSNELQLTLHPNKSKIIPIKRGIDFLGFRNFYKHRLLKKRNIRKMRSKLDNLIAEYGMANVTEEEILEVMQGWISYAKNADSFGLLEQIGMELKLHLHFEIVANV